MATLNVHLYYKENVVANYFLSTCLVVGGKIIGIKRI